MVNDKKNDFDVIIIGAGISGLVCGCYLAKEGKNVLIAEQHHSPGGYCSSFVRSGYVFDSAAHFLGGVKKGILAVILKELGINIKDLFVQFDPSDKLLLKKNIVYIRSDSIKTQDELKRVFPEQSRNIEKFFEFVLQPNTVAIYRKTHKANFQSVLNSFFKDSQLKVSLGVFMLGNMGLPPSKISAFAAIIFLREFLLDPGYYPQGGIQKFTNLLVEKFKSLNGKMILSSQVKRIITKSTMAQGIVLDSGESFSAKIIVSGIDATHLFRKILDVKTKEADIVKKLKESVSYFAIYLGIREKIENIFGESCNIWDFPHNDLDKIYNDLIVNTRKMTIPCLVFSFSPGKMNSFSNKINNTAQIFSMASYESEEFWKKNKMIYANKILKRAYKLFPNLKKNIDIMEIATPVTFNKYTINKNGSAFGWESSVDQIANRKLDNQTSIKNLFLIGHWVITGAGQGGISTVALSGRKVAKRIVKVLT
ncbi:MAG: NAD(P)/FAD-dependent oxidoreductase [Candidatus Omnitrophica bacterium]|nr:NAD(P)/FAD-dependent oxidoreductase [Candidatus Omnitrophota bacterium]